VHKSLSAVDVTVTEGIVELLEASQYALRTGVVRLRRDVTLRAFPSTTWHVDIL
jgi:hypothetical protein